MSKEEYRERIDGFDDERMDGYILLDGFDDCIVGVGSSLQEGGYFSGVIYDTEKIINKLMDRDGMTLEEAIEHYDFNIAGGYFGEFNPIFLTKLED